MRLLLIVAALAAWPTEAHPCSISGTPAAYAFTPASGQPPGRQPWLRLWRVTGKVAMTIVSAGCADKTVCAGTAVAFEQSGELMRPKAALANGARVQVTSGKTLLADFKVATAPAPPLPAWDGITWVSAGNQKEGLCSPAGPAVQLAVKPTRADLDAAVLLVYLEKPDPKRPLAKLAQIAMLGAGKTIELGNGLGAPVWLKAVPKRIWVAIADGEGNVGPAISLP